MVNQTLRLAQRLDDATFGLLRADWSVIWSDVNAGVIKPLADDLIERRHLFAISRAGPAHHQMHTEVQPLP